MNKVNKKRSPLIKIAKGIGIALIIIVCFIGVMLFTQKPVNLEISNVNLALVRDGIYEGSADNGLVKAKVKVEIKNATIVDISILEHEQLLGKKSEVIIDNIIKAQTLEVDSITGATYSSDTIKKAVENALRKGE